MKEYPPIPKSGPPGLTYYLFDKIDGSNIRAEWNRKHKTFTKFGSRTLLIDKSHPLGEAIDIVKTKYEKDLNERLLALQVPKAICFFEFWGPKSFAGNHVAGDPKTVTLIDINLHPKGLMLPKDFLEVTKGLDIPKLLYKGLITPEVTQQIVAGTLPGMTFEGVVAKANTGAPGLPFMFKIKNRAWLEKLKTFCKGDEKMFERLL